MSGGYLLHADRTKISTDFFATRNAGPSITLSGAAYAPLIAKWECAMTVHSVPKKSYGRGVGTMPNCCSSKPDNDAGLCYPNCKSGYNGVGPMCWKKDPFGLLQIESSATADVVDENTATKKTFSEMLDYVKKTGKSSTCRHFSTQMHLSTMRALALALQLRHHESGPFFQGKKCSETYYMLRHYEYVCK